MNTTSNIQLMLNRLQNGDEAAKADLLVFPLERIRTLARKLFRGKHDLRAWEETDDVVQKALQRLRRSLDQVRPPANPREFFGLAAKQIRWVLGDLGRVVQKPRPVPLDSAALADDTLAGSAPDHDAQAAERFAKLHDIVDQLPDEDKEVVDLLYFNGQSQDEAALTLGVSVRTVKRRWRSAKLLIQQGFQGENPLEE